MDRDTALAESAAAGVPSQPAAVAGASDTGAQQSSSAAAPETQLRGNSTAEPQGPVPAATVQQPSQKHEVSAEGSSARSTYRI